jgi:hypothetical protein
VKCKVERTLMRKIPKTVPDVAADLPEYRTGPCKACKFWKQSNSYAKYLSVETKKLWGKCASAEGTALIEGNIARAIGDPRATSGSWPLAVGGAVTREDFGCPFFGVAVVAR